MGAERDGLDLAAFAARDPNDDTERMLTQIVNGVAKRDADTVYDADTVHDAASSGLWDRMSAGVACMKREGKAIDYDNGA